MDQISQFFITLILIITIFNVLTVRSLKSSDVPVMVSVALLIPMRNERENAGAALSSALAQTRLDHFKIRVLDDDSDDGTREILSKIEDSRYELLSPIPLPDGWLGKNHALHQLALRSPEEFLVFMDADVRLEPNAIADSIALMRKLDWDFISPYPRQIAKNPVAKLVQPLLQWSWFASLPLRLVERSRSTSTVVANGQFFIVRNEMYRKIDGHQLIKSEVLDDMELARALRRAGGVGSVVDGSRIAYCEMYKDPDSLIAGYSKSQWRAFGGTLGALIAIFILFTSSIYPFIRAVQGEIWAIFACIGLVLSRLAVAIRTRSVTKSAPLHPLAISLWIGLIIRSLLLKRNDKLLWRGRSI